MDFHIEDEPARHTFSMPSGAKQKPNFGNHQQLEILIAVVKHSAFGERLLLFSFPDLTTWEKLHPKFQLEYPRVVL